MTACTIIARNYLAQARVLAESYLAHHPGSRFFTLIIDAPGPATQEPFETVGPTEIGLDPGELERMAAVYDVMELSTAVKPWFLKRLRQESEEVIYLDPDIQVFASLEAVKELAREHSIVLTPHAPSPSPHDRTVPGEITFLLAGIYNLGFIAVGPGSDPFLGWWAERVARDCIVAPQQGHFVDQRWVDFVPGLFDHFILRDPAYNVAWWNLPERTLRWDGNRYTIDGEQLRFFHFSGFDPRLPHLLSKHQGPTPRTLLSDHPDLARICNDYARALFDAGWAEVSSLPYRHDTGPAGLPIDARMRRLYRDELLDAEENGTPEPPNPFTDEPGFLRWLREPTDTRGGAVRVSRYLQELYRERPDLQAKFPDIRWVNADAFLHWVVGHGQEEADIPLELLPEAPEPAPAAGRDLDHQGVNVAGYFRAEGGVGEAGRALIAALEAAGIDFGTVNYEKTPNRQEHPFRHGDSPARYDVNVICVNADQLPEFTYHIGPEFFADRYSIGLWWWEVSRFPERFHDAFAIVQEIWVGSEFAAAAIGRETSKPVRVLPIAVEPRVVTPVPRHALGLPEGFQFLFSFDFHSVFERKNPVALVEAFKAAFEPGEGPNLVLKSINGDKHLVELERLRAAAADRPDVVVLDRYLSAQEKDGLMSGCDCYVSLHRSEGFGLTMAEAMALGKPVIATAYSGNLMFMTESNSYLVPYEPVSVPAGCDPYPVGAEWAEPDIGRAAELMRQVVEHQEAAREVGVRAREDMRRYHSSRQSAEFVADRLEEIRQLADATTAAEAPAAPSVAAGRGPVDVGARYVAEGPSIPWDTPSRRGPAKVAQWLVRRLLRPYAMRHQELDAAVVEAVGIHQRALEDLDASTREVLANAATRSDIATVEQRLATTQRRQLDRLRHLEQLVGAIHESVEAQLASVSEHLTAQAQENERAGRFEQVVRRRFPQLDARPDGDDTSEPNVETFPNRFAPPERPWTSEYAAAHRRLVREALNDARFLERVRAGDALPPGYGVGLDERVVELPWLLAQQPSGRMLDAGSALNHEHVLDRVRPLVTSLDVVTLVPEEISFTDKHVSYLYADLRDLPYRDDQFATVASLSTLEHVGMDNTMYGVDAAPADDPGEETRRALAELVRVAAPGGVILVTLPFGRSADYGWMRQFDQAGVEELARGVPSRRTSFSVYHYSREGWQVSDFGAAADAEYRDYVRDPSPVDDLAAAARAAVCIRFELE